MVSKSKIVQMSRDGRITIPAEFRRTLGIESGVDCLMVVESGILYFVPFRNEAGTGGSAWVREFYDEFAPVRAAIAAAGYSEAEVNADIDAAIRAVRAERG